MSSIYSQKIFSNSGFVTMKELDYKEFVDRRDNERELLMDTREHKGVKVVSFKLF